MTIARGTPVALFRLIFSVDISVSFYARKRERPLGVGMSVVTVSITEKSINEKKKQEQRGKIRENERETWTERRYRECVIDVLRLNLMDVSYDE